ncbi:MAG: hypothetical protein E7441_06940 [Ruminococcaceae bacterium]|nr:hypothetical protein [Oscillospiraceae bacterium]
MKIKALLIGIVSALLLVMAGCRTAPPDEAEILQKLPGNVANIQMNNPFSSSTSAEDRILEIESLRIDSRHTEGGNDRVFCTIELKDNVYHVTKEILCIFNYYGESGWVLEEWQDDSSPIYTLVGEKPFSDEHLIDYVEKKYDGVEMRDFEQAGNSVKYSLYVQDEHPYCGSYGKYNVLCKLGGNGWEIANEEDGVQTVWNIKGKWMYTRPNGKDKMILEITDYDIESGILKGTWSCSLSLFGSAMTSGFSYPLSDASRVGIAIDKKKISIYDNPTIITMHNAIEITPDKILASGVRSGVIVFTNCEMTRVE